MITIVNAFSLQMLDLSACVEVVRVKIDPINEQATLADLLEENVYVSAVGHVDTANLFTNLLGVNVACNRVNVQLTEDNSLLVGQIVGGRLPEGATTLPEGVKVQWMFVSLA